MSEVAPKVVPVLGHPEVIRVLEDALAGARRGEVAGVGLVRVGVRGLQTVVAGGHPMEVHVGAAMLQQQCLGALQRPASKIIGVR